MEKDKVRLTELVHSSGCNAKLPPGDLDAVLKSLPVFPNGKLLAGYETADDAFVYDLGNGLSMLQTVDFFPPMVDDPVVFGEIAAANALSDIYAMGGDPAVALSIVCFPSCLSLSVLHDIMLGAIGKAKEAGCTIAGGHTISDREPKFGLAVTGFVGKDKVWQNKGAVPGDVLVLTKKLGTGITMTALKGDEADENSISEALLSMRTLNRKSKEQATATDVHAATDVTGFSLMGHSSEMAAASGVSIVIDWNRLPLLEGVKYAQFGFVPEGRYTNEDYIGPDADTSALNQDERDIVYSPETSGGLLLAVPESDAHLIDGWVIGKVTEKRDKNVFVKK